jgi:uncharacterized protein YrrD
MEHLRNLKDLIGFSLEARDGEIGELKEVYFDDQVWFVRYLVVHTGGRFFGREVLVTPQVVESIDDDARRIVLNLVREQVENSPPVGSERPVSRHYEAQYHFYYGLDPYWVMAPFGPPPAPTPMPLPGAAALEPEHPHLRSSEEVCGYHIAARDGEIGKVEDFIIDDSDWSIAYVSIDTRRWLPGRPVLISPAWVEAVDWPGKSITVDVVREAIKSAPEYDPSKLITADYEAELFAHYGKSLPPRGKQAPEKISHA